MVTGDAQSSLDFLFLVLRLAVLHLQWNADGAIVNADVNASAAIEAYWTLNFNVDLGGNVQFGTQSDDISCFRWTKKAGGNAIADSGNNAAVTGQ